MSMDALLAAAPLLLVLGLMLGLGWSALRAGLAGLGLALVLVWLHFPIGAGLPHGVAAAGLAAESGFLTLGILWILWPALALYRYQQASGAHDALRQGLATLSAGRDDPQRPGAGPGPSQALQALVIGLLLALFLEGAAGFGTPVALVAPLLVGLGFRPIPAVVLALIGHALAVNFGALGTPVLTQAALTGVAATDIAWRIALLQIGLGLVVLVAFRRSLAVEGVVLPWRWLLLAGYAFLLPSLLLVIWFGPELGSFGAALLALGLVLWRLQRRTAAGASSGAGKQLRTAFAPYLLLVALVVASRLLPLEGQLELEWSLSGRYHGQLDLLQHPGTLLLAALLATAWLQGRRLDTAGSALIRAGRDLLPVALALAAMLLLSRLMLDAGMVRALEQAAVTALGAAWPALAPTLGALGSFVTGSATASNVLFSSLQANAAAALGLPPAWLLAGQTLGASVGNIICPHNVVAGAATVGLAGREGEIIRQTLPVCLVYLAAAGLLLWLLLALA